MKSSDENHKQRRSRGVARRRRSSGSNCIIYICIFVFNIPVNISLA
ncbi:unnamed protein product [Brassica oleracea var. botrytis]|uniref:(rape) hypothetical protein n=1 Tax=Brassica napus TaxID=3708 RepID=A0A816KXM7_BRANA|nr:unnamed protein product [Brassica napus]